MINKIVQRLRFYRSIRFFHYLYLNHFCSRVIRTDQSRIIPYRGAVVELEPGAKLYLRGGDLELGCDRLRHSREETLIRLRKNAVWSCDSGCRISYGATIEVLNNALLDTGFFTMNSRSVLVTSKQIRMGRDVMIGRGVVIYDSDHHAIRNVQGQVTNPDSPVRIGDHVWLATNVMVLKGSIIGSGSIAAANSMIHGTVPADSVYRNEGTREGYGTWSREHP
jgi:acetyltransferase-like isoleucine patch superfamily enzyme